MDFGTLLHKAQRNGQTEKKEIRYYSTKFEPPKKEQRTKTLSANIQKFLERKEQEEKKKLQEAHKRRDQLLELRSKDKKATRRVSVMLKRTKSANQSVLQDAVDTVNTAVTLAGPSQPDEDDYGYVSQSAADYYNKMMEKYSKMPDEPKFQLGKKKVSTNLSGTKDRVKAALDKERDEALLPHRRKRKHKDKETGDPEGAKEPEEKGETYVKEKQSKPKLKPAPVINFSDLLKIAEKKQFEPIVIEPKKEKEERPLTKKQKREFEVEREWREKREQRALQQEAALSSPPPNNKIPKLNTSKTGCEIKAPKMNGLCDKIPRANDHDTKPSNSRSDDRSNTKSQDRPMKTSQKPPEFKKPFTDRSVVDKSKLSKDPKSKPPLQGKLKDALTRDLKPKSAERPKQFPPNDGRPKQFPPNDVRPKQFPPSDVRSKQLNARPKQFTPQEMRRPQGPGGAKPPRKPLISKGRMYDDDEEEYDSEMDDFIDDGEDEADYSKYISEIFGYDKKKYSYADDDVDNMETTFAQQMREEVISTKIGIMEDLEDMKQEEEDKRKKAIMKKKLKSR